MEDRRLRVGILGGFMASKVGICNLSLSHLGIGKEVAILETEQSQEAAACRRFYDTARRATLSDLNWSFATEFYTLGLIEESPSDEWDFSYRYPATCITIRRILSGLRNDTSESRIPFKLLKDDAGRLIYTDQENAEIEMTKDVEDTTFFPDDFVLALSFRLASYIAPRVTGGDPFKLKKDMIEQYNIEMGRARANAFNEEITDNIPESLSITARN